MPSELVAALATLVLIVTILVVLQLCHVDTQHLVDYLSWVFA